MALQHCPSTIEESPLDPRTLIILEFPAVLERLARLTAFSAGREAALALRPVTDREVAVRRQRETAEALALLLAGTDLPLAGAHDVRSAAEAARLGGMLTGQQLLEVASTIRAAERVARAAQRVAQEAPLLSAIGTGCAGLGPLRSLIEQSITERAEVASHASPQLAQIRRELGGAHDRLRQRIEALLRDATVRVALQEPLVTQRDGRYVIPVRSEARGAVPGVVHDTSASGATVYIEPFAVVDLGNRWRELQLQERHEVERVLRDLSTAAGEAAADLADMVRRLAAIDCAAARARLAREWGATALHRTGTEQPWLAQAPAELRLVEARHPLIEGNVVPVSLAVGGDWRALLITGPNTGGKTVALKTAGLLTLMALAGLPVPAEAGSQVPVYDAVFADIGDEQSIAQSLSTFSGHVTAIIDIMERATSASLVLLDELGAGTDPIEGAALAVAIVDRLVAQGAALIATTHHSELKLYAHEQPGVMNASVEFDVETLSPTYRLTIGLPGQSNALAIAERLGMPADVIGQARDGLSHQERDLERVLAELRTQLTAAEEQALETATVREDASRLRRELQRQLAGLAAETAQLREEARSRVREELRETERLVERTRRQVEAARLGQAVADLDRARQAAAAIPAPPPAVLAPLLVEPGAPSAVTPGVRVWLRGIPSPGEALSAPNAAGEFEVLLGSLHTRVRLTQVQRIAAPGESPRPLHLDRLPPEPELESVPEEIEVRGRTIEEAIPEVEHYIDRAARAGRPRVRVVHGKGTGALRQAVRELLAGHPLVITVESGGRAEGGEGVTVAHLAHPRR